MDKEVANGPNSPDAWHHPFVSKELALLWRLPLEDETDTDRLIFALRERIKELNCLYAISQLAERHAHSIDDLLRELVAVLPYSWQYPELACARILFEEKTYVSDRFRITNWRQSARIYMYQEAVGEVTIFYLEECPPADEGPFLKEERALLDAVAEHIGTIATRMSVEMELMELNRQLTLERQALQEANAALRVLLSRMEQEKQEIYADIKTNVEKVVMPILRALSSQISPMERKYVELLQTSLDEIASPYIRRLALVHHSLTPTEIAICNMIRSGMHTKEIAEIRGVSEATINHHRENIRRKLKITNRRVNLASYLQSALWEGQSNEAASRK